MRYKRFMIILVLAVFLLSITCVSASEIDDTLASEDTNTIGLSADNDIIEDNLQTSEENEALASTDYDEAIAQTDTEVLGADSATYFDLAEEIGHFGDITLTHKNYTYDGGEPITISEEIKVIDGNGAVIDMNGSTIRAFYVIGSGVTIKNLTIKNANCNGDGGAIYFRSSGTVTNCNFADNKATGDGGAVYFLYTGTVTNCNFADNEANYGGAVYFYDEGTVSNCNFTNNTASVDGGAVYFYVGTGSVTNCNFTNNKATGDDARGGAINMGSGTVSNCNFTDNSASSDGGAVYFWNQGTVTNCNFTGNTASITGGAVYFYQGTGTVSNCNFTNNTATDGGAIYYSDGTTGEAINCNFKDNLATSSGGALVFLGTGTVTGCNFINNAGNSGSGGAIYFIKGTMSDCNFTNNKAIYGGAVYIYSAGNVANCNFVDNKVAGDYSYGGAVYFSSTGNVTNCNFADNTATFGGAVYFLNTGNVTNCNFVNNSATGEGSWGGAIRMYSGTVSNCNFTDNTASSQGGAIRFSGSGTVTNCNFAGNTATDGGAVYFWDPGTVSNCNFTGNNATTGSAIYFWITSASKTVSNSCFLNNRANAEALDVVKNDNNITITFTGQNNLLNAIYSREDAEVTFTNVTYWGAKGITTVSARLSGSNKAAGQNITVGVVVNGEIVLNNVKVTNENGMIVLDITAGENYYISARHNTDSYYTEAEKTITNNTKLSANVTSQTTHNKTVNITAKSNIYSEFMPGKLLFILPNGTQINATYGANGIWWAEHTFDAYGEYKVNATYVGLDNVTVNNATITVKIKTELSGNAITTTYNINKDLIITLKDSNGNPVSGAKLIVDLNGAKTYTTDSNGQVKVSTKGLAPNVYTAKVTFDGNTNYDKSALDVKVTVNKATPKLTAKKKTFKSSVKTKKYTIVLKDNTGKAIKKAKVTLKVKGKTYKATTNSKGKATFKIKNLKKKGKFKAVIKFKGDKYYKKATKKAKIKVIITFKTVSKGSKDKSTVKEIQQALKDNGYYLSYKGHYLKVDGKFSSCTFRSVKEFQHDKGLKVTGKVDEKTAKKLGII